MPRGRMINKKISKNKLLASISAKSALLYSWCIPHLDSEGRLEGSPEIIKGVVVPYRRDFTLKVIASCIKEIDSKGELICYYGNPHKYIQFLGFCNNQTINKDREAPSEIPMPTLEELKNSSCATPPQVKSKLNLNISKDKYKEFVYLFKEEHQKLIDVYKEKITNDYIQRLNDYLGSTGKQYKSHYHTILNWIRRDPHKNNPQPEYKARKEGRFGFTPPPGSAGELIKEIAGKKSTGK